MILLWNTLKQILRHGNSNQEACNYEMKQTIKDYILKWTFEPFQRKDKSCCKFIADPPFLDSKYIAELTYIPPGLTIKYNLQETIELVSVFSLLLSLPSSYAHTHTPVPTASLSPAPHPHNHQKPRQYDRRNCHNIFLRIYRKQANFIWWLLQLVSEMTI